MLMFSFDKLTFLLFLSPISQSSDSYKPFFHYTLKCLINSTLFFEDGLEHLIILPQPPRC